MYNSKRQVDKYIVDKIIQRDEQVLFDFIKTYEKSLITFINKKINNISVAEEIAQDVFMDFLEALRGFQYQSSLKTFLFSIAKYKTIDVIRKKKLKQILFSSLPSYFVESLAPVFIDNEIERKELVQKMDRAFALLPEKYRIILQMKYVDGVQVRDIAERLSMNFKSTESLLFRARKAFIASFSSID